MDPTPFTPPSIETLNQLLPSYQFLDFIAQGGMGAVYLAKQISLDREVAVKILPRELSADPEFRASFQTEARAMARLNHPNLISIYDSGDVDGMLYIAMEYVPGKSLYHSAWNKIIDPAEASRIIIGICEGLSHAHENGIIHRDIKPANILLTPKAEPKIGDFGLAQAVGVKHEGIVMGTPGYAAPEVLTQPDKADRRSDIFAVGVMLHELLTGQKPQPGVTASSLSQCPTEFDTIIQRATHPSPVMRYPDANAMAQAIRAALESKSNQKAQPRIAVAGQRTAAGPRSIITPHAPAQAPTLLTSADKNDPRSPAPSTTIVAQTRKAQSSIVRNLLIIAALLFVVVFVYQKLEIHQQDVAKQNEILAQQQKAQAKGVNKITPPPPTPDRTPPQLPEPTTTRTESPRESLDRLKDLLASGSREELPLSSIRRGDMDFFYVGESMTWDQALLFAEEHGAFIAYPQSEDDLSFFGNLIKNNDAIWLGAGRSGRQEWILLNGQPWPIAKSPPGVGHFATLSPLGVTRASEPSKHLPFIIAWNRDGSNPCSLEAMLKATKASIDAGKPTYPAGTHQAETRHFLPIIRSLTLAQAEALASLGGAHIAALSQREESYWVKDHLAKVDAPRGILLSGEKQNGVWQWKTKEPWTYANWAKDYPTSDDDDTQLAYLPNEGWINQSPEEEADGVVLEWSKDHSAPSTETDSPPTAAPDIAGLVTRCRELLTASKREYEEGMAKNVKSFQWDLDVWTRNLKAQERNRWSNTVEILKSLAEENNKIPSAAKATRIIEAERADRRRRAFRQFANDDEEDIREKRKILRNALEEEEEYDDDLIAMPPGIVKAHNFALTKQIEIENAATQRNTKIRDAFVLKIKDMGSAAQQAGQLDLVRELRDYLDATKELDSWIKSMIDPL